MKRLNFLDFDGKNVCYCIFFSFWVFYIVLIDILKGLDRLMDEGFYSDWMYVGKLKYLVIMKIFVFIDVY